MEEDYEKEDFIPKYRSSSDFVKKEINQPHFHTSDNPNQKGFKSVSSNLSKSQELSDIDKELEELVKKQHAKVKVFGVGGAGGNTISRMREIGIKGGEFIALNTDAQDLLYSNADYKILLGRELTMGLGAGSNPKVGEEAAHESEQEIKKKLSNCDMVFITCGLGGGTGSGAAAVIANLAKKPVETVRAEDDVLYVDENGNLTSPSKKSLLDRLMDMYD
jgi:cell division GTPase FtsZ